MNTETLDKIYLEWSQFTTARTSREIEMDIAIRDILYSEKRNFETAEHHLDWCKERASKVRPL